MSNIEKITYLNGARLKRALIAGSKRVIARHDHLNKINVFPVSDSDTGTNISITLSAGLKAVALEKDESLCKVLEVFADGTLDAARGNSGTIFAQWFQGFNDASEGLDELDSAAFMRVYRAAAAHAYSAVADPVEGTILTVLEDTAEYFKRMKSPPADFAELFDKLMVKANESLQETPKKLKILKKYGVVDAGAQALVDFLEGITQFIHEGDIKNLDAEIAEIVENEHDDDCLHEHADHIGDYTYRYCTECVIVGDDISQAQLKKDVAGLGDSLVVAGSRRKTKIHMHVNQPAELFSVCRNFGKLHNEKAEDMFHQVKDAHAKHSDVAIVTDSAIDLPQAVIDSLNIHVIPIQIHVGEDVFIDGITITPDDFYRIVEEQGVIPKTAHPTYRDFKAKYQFLASHYKSVVSLHISSLMSNTFGAAELVQRDMANSHVNIVNTLNVSAGQGLLVQYAAELANAGHSAADIIDKVNHAIPKVQVYAMVGNLDYAVKGGRLPKSAKRVADWFKVRPILALMPGKKAKIAGVIRGKNHITRQFAKKILAKLEPSKRYRLGLIHCQAPEQGQKLLEMLTMKSRNIESSYLVNCGVTIGAHAGPGTLGVAILELD
jgi:DegV family protein with EDD domain